MIDKKNIARFFKGKGKQPGEGIAYYISDAKHAWKIIILVFMVLNIGIIAFSSYLFFQINDGDIFTVEQDIMISVETIDRTLLRETLSSFEEMERELEDLRERRSRIVDPSL
ncbi:MAG: hypothetical protein QGG63_01670 [Candidatus Pacebacteria bacterium]|jgi:hypothetical protein|nr:hypothetical protein [Candidatus Paceibacterota bacterium]|tara:strand:- start:30682 stop:31017 length:336 start_codon:yes stop_codon:yes gene_type:complete